jgi:N-acyl-L-homoserine lactone synthetase
VGSSIGGRIVDLARFSAYPSLHAPVGAGAIALAAGLLSCALLPFADRRGVQR